MATTIKLKNGSGAPSAGDLVVAEPALDLTNKRLYTEDSGGTVIEVGTNPGTDVTFADNRKAIFGAGSDLQIYHDGSHSYIDEQGSGRLYINSGNGVWFANADGSEISAKLNVDSACEFRYDNAIKLATTSTGIDVTGTVTADGLTVDGDITLDTEGDKILFETSNALLTPSIYADDDDIGNSLKITADNGVLVRVDERDAGSGGFKVQNGSTHKEALFVNNNGDISFYEDTGTTAKLFWDASAESLSITGNANVWTIDNTTIYGNRAGGSIYVGNSDATGEFGITSGGSVAMQFDSSGNVGIGTSDPKTLLDIADTAAELTITSTRSSNSAGDLLGGINFYNADGSTNGPNNAASIKAVAATSLGADADLIFSTKRGASSGADALEAMRIDSSGNVGIGTSSPSAKLGINASAPDFTMLQSDTVKFRSGVSGTTNGGVTGSASGDYFARTAGGKMLFSTNDGVTAHAVIDASGHLLVGTTSANYAGVDLAVGNTADGQNGIAIQTSTTGYGYVLFGDGTGASAYVGQITYKHDDNYMAFNTAGTERMRVDSSGHVGIKVTPAAWRSSQDVLQVGNGAITNYTDLVTVLSHNSYHDGTGNKYITTGQEAYQIALSSYDNAMMFNYAASGTAGNAVSFSEAMRIDSSGNLLVGTTSTVAGGKISAQAVGSNPAIAAQGASDCFQGRTTQTSGNSYFAYWVYNGSVVGSITSTGSSTAYNTSSDYRLKENVVPLTGATERVKQLNPSRFNFIADADTTVDGFLAHEVADVVPEAITGTKDAVDDDGNAVYQSIDQSKLVPLLVATIQELEARIAALESN